jgi:hypothetical protein
MEAPPYVKSVEASHMFRFFLAAIAAVSLTAPVAALAQDAPSYAQPADSSYANGGDENVHGRVINFDGGYNLEVRDDRGFVDIVQLHDGTIINPTGLTLAPGMVVSILGYNAGSFFAANEIDTPYTLENDVPWYSGQPWYNYGSSYSLDFFFGNVGWWHRSFSGGDHRGDFHGRVFVAPPERGGYYPHHGGSFSGGYHGGSFNDGGYHGGIVNNGGYHGGNFNNGGYHGGNFNNGGYHGGNFNGGGYRGGNVNNGGYHGGNSNSGGYHGGNAGGNFNGGDRGGHSNGGGYHGGNAGGDTRGHGSDRRR